MIPLPLLPNTMSNVRIIPVEDDTMEPTFRKGDAVVVVPAGFYSGEGMYLIDKGYPAAYRVSPLANGNLSISRDNSFYGEAREWTHQMFEELVIGKVGAYIRVFNESVFQASSSEVSQ